MPFKHRFTEIEIPKLVKVEGAGGRRYQTPDGNSYPSITTILSEMNKDNVGLKTWRNRVGNEQADAITRQSTTQGTKLHKLCEDYLQNKPLEYDSPFILDMFTSMKKALNRIDNIYLQEKSLYSDHLRIAGTVDCVAEFDGRMSIIDFKNSRKIKQEHHITHYFIQACAYAIMFEERFKIPVPNIVILITVEDESFPQIFIEKRDKYVKDLLQYRDRYESIYGSAS